MDASSSLAIRDHLAQAQTHLEHARAIAEIGIVDVSAREAYQSAFHAAEALLIARTGRRAKTHSGLRTSIARLASESDDLNREWGKFPARAYDLKSLADYGTKVDAVTADDARFAIDGAQRMIDEVALLLCGSAET